MTVSYIDKHKVFRVVSPITGFIIVLFILSWLFGRIEDLRKDSIINVQIQEITKKPKPKKKKEPKPASLAQNKKNEPKPKAKKSQPEPKKIIPKKKNVEVAKQKTVPKRTAGGVYDEGKIPAITIYYGHHEIDKYMTALAIRDCIFFIKSPMGKLFATYDPMTGKTTTRMPESFSGYSPRTRVLAIYGENEKADRIIEEAVRRSPMMSFPDECRLIGLISLRWEDTLLSTITNAASLYSIPPEKIESAEAMFSGDMFILNKISVTGGKTIIVNREIS